MDVKFSAPPPGCYTGKMLFASRSKIIANWFLTLQLFLGTSIICNFPKWAQERACMQYALSAI